MPRCLVLGLGMHLLSRPFESVFLLLSVILFFAAGFPETLGRRPALIAALVCLPAIGIVLAQNKQVTGNWMTLPYCAQPVPIRRSRRHSHSSHIRFRTTNSLGNRRWTTGCNALSAMPEIDTPGSLLAAAGIPDPLLPVLFLPAALSGAVVFLVSMREYRFVWIALTVLIFALGTNFYPLFLPHYIAAVLCLFVLMSVEGLRKLSQWPAGGGRGASPDLPLHRAICFSRMASIADVDTGIHNSIPEQRIEINRQTRGDARETVGARPILAAAYFSE